MVKKKSIITHLEKDVKDFKHEIKEDKSLLKKLKKPKSKKKGK